MAGERIQRVKGMQDILPRQYALRDEAWRTLQAVFERYGYGGIEVPIVEPLELHVLKSGEEIRRHMYAFKDLGGRDLCLRPEITASVVRAFNAAMASTPLPVRLYYIGPAFRYDRPQEGRYRQFTHVGIEVLGGAGPEFDAEVIRLACEGIEAIGLPNYIVLIGHVGPLSEFLGHLGLEERAKSFFMESLEDFSKAPDHDAGLKLIRDGVARLREEGITVPDAAVEKALAFIGELAAIRGAPADALGRLERLIGLHSADGLTRGVLDDLRRLHALLDAYGHDWSHTRLDFGFGRGLTYYTGVIFQLHCPNLGAADQVCGGGRYDELVELLGGRPGTKAVGFAYGFDRLLLSLERTRGTAESIEVLPRPPVQALVVSIDEATYPYAIRAAAALRNAGIKVELASAAKKARRLAERADALGIPAVFFLGPDEERSRSLKWKTMRTGTEATAPLDDVSRVADLIRREAASSKEI